MTRLPRFDRSDRVLVFAPHPDDETLAAGILLQGARAVGAAVRVVFATDGENNPWPQRWLERRWRIGAAERARWARRRRSEAGEALALLGIDVAREAEFLGWPDQGLTEVLMRDGEGVARLAAILDAFAPTHVVLPTLADRHPDHSALRVLLELAMAAAGSTAAKLGYLVHGARDGAAVDPAEAGQSLRKQQAMEAHASQMALSRSRLRALAARTEAFEPGDRLTRAPAADGDGLQTRVPWRPGWLPRRHELLLVGMADGRVARLRGSVPQGAGAVRIAPVDGGGPAARARRVGGTLEIVLPVAFSSLYAKVHRADPRLLIFDRCGWHEAAEGRPDAAPLAAARPVVASLG
jgi:LmbE family N-acetylglucosaminyl deacetylase